MDPESLIRAARAMQKQLSVLRFAKPVTHVYDPLAYAWAAHAAYLKLLGNGPKRVIFVGMNPGPFGMTQTGVPFGEVRAVREWLGVQGRINRPAQEHPKRPITGFDCQRSEVSGRRLWGLFAARFGTVERFAVEHFVTNYCPLVFMEESGKNRTPEQLPAAEAERVRAICDAHLCRVVEVLKPAVVVGVGRYAAARAGEALNGLPIAIATISHPSPANPAANKDWIGLATRELIRQGIWSG